MLDQVRHLRDQMGGDHHGAGALGVFPHQQLVEQIPVLGVQAQDGLVEQHVGGVDAEAQNNTEDGAVAGGETVDLLVQRQLELPGQVLGIGPVEIRVEQLRRVQGPLHLHVVGVQVLLPHQEQPAQGRVAAGGGAVHGDGAAVRAQPPGEDIQQRGLAGAVVAQQSVDFPLLKGQ